MRMPKGIPFVDTYKYTKRFEMAVSLFEACNMKCDFCFQNQKAQRELITPEKIMKAYPIIRDYLENVIKTKDVEVVDLKLWGGEIFSDNLSDEVINTYAEFVEKLQESLSVPLTVVFLSNGIHTKYERIKNMIDSIDVVLKKVMLSYDSAGRFQHPAQVERFKKSMEYYMTNDLFGGLSIVLSRPAIKAYVAGDEILDSLPPEVYVNCNYYIANQKWPQYLPSWKDVFEFLQYCVRTKKFSLDIIENIFRGLIPHIRHTVAKMCNCHEAAQYNSGEGRCSSNCINDRIRDIDVRKYFYGDIADEITPENQFFVRSYMLAKKNGCYTCEHFTNCTQMCGASVVFKEYDAEKCPIKELLNTVTNNDINEFKEYFFRRYGEKI